MRGRWRNRPGFRADPDAVAASRPSRRQTIALLSVLALVAGAIALVSYLIRPEKARAFDLFHGSLFLSDQNSPVAVDLTTGKPTLRLVGAGQQVGIGRGEQPLSVVPLTDDTLLLNGATGEFNMVDNSGFVVKHDGGGVPLGPRSGTSSSSAVASRNGQAYIVQTGSSGGTDVYLVNQSTVESAIGASGSLRPRASGSMPERGSSAASANGDLWLLAGQPGKLRTIREFSVPAGSSTGATLVRSDHGQVNGPAAIGTATAAADGTGPDVVGTASLSRIDLFTPGASDPLRETYTPPAGVDRILPTSNAMGRLAFLMHGSAGWYITSVNADGTGLRVPARVRGLPEDADLAEPAASNGRLYTIDQAKGNLYQIGYDGTAGPADRAQYPIPMVRNHSAELRVFDDAYVTARGPRVIFNSPTHADALMLFTDGSHAPRTIVKSTAIIVNAARGADALTKSTAPPGRTGKKQGGTPKPTQDVEQVNNNIDCKTVRQKPHVPVLNQPHPGSRSVALSWTYPILSPQDCYPSTYVVSLTLVSANAPAAPGQVKVQGQTGATISGLFPSTRYDVKVTAYIKGQSTDSRPLQFQTGPEGPAAPSDLSVAADSSGNWKLSWDSCGTVLQGCVAAQSWTITPSFCDGRGVSSPPQTRTVTGDPTSKRQPPATYRGSDDLLGRGLQFQVQGNGDQGQAGTPSAKSRCVYSWRPPNPSAMTLSASRPHNTALGGTSKTNVTLDLGNDPVRAVGGVGARVTFRLNGPGGTQTKGPIIYNGNGSALSASFGGVSAGASYTASATVHTAHGGASANLPAVQVTARANWPDMSLSASCPASGLLHLTCDLTVNIHGLSSARADGELFDTVDTNQALSQIRCFNQAQPIQRSNFDPAEPITVNDVSLVLNHGGCTVTVILHESAGNKDPLVFGGTVSPVLTTEVTLGSPTTLDATGDDFGATWEHNAATVDVQYTGNLRDDQVNQIATGWVEQVFAPGGQPCGMANQQPTGQGAQVLVRQDCVDNYGDSTSGWKATVTYTDVGYAPGTGHDHTVTASDPQLTGGPPTYQFCTPSGFSATWSGSDKTPTIDVDKPDDGDLSGCRGWSYDLADPHNNACPTSGGGKPPTTLSVNCDVVTGDWTLTISWTTPDGRNPSKQITVGGTPPIPPSPSPSSSPS